jgi:hypothetical protein
MGQGFDMLELCPGSVPSASQPGLGFRAMRGLEPPTGTSFAARRNPAFDLVRQVPTAGRPRRGTLPGLVRTGATFADAAAEFLRFVEHDRAIKPSMLCDYRSIISTHLLPAFGDLRLEEITPQKIERWHPGITSRRAWRPPPPRARPAGRRGPRPGRPLGRTR